MNFTACVSVVISFIKGDVTEENYHKIHLRMVRGMNVITLNTAEISERKIFNGNISKILLEAATVATEAAAWFNFNFYIIEMVLYRPCLLTLSLLHIRTSCKKAARDSKIVFFCLD